MGKVAFELKDGYRRVEVNVQELDKPVVVSDGGFSTSEPSIIQALDAAEGVKRSEGRAPAEGKPQTPPKSATQVKG